MQVGPVLAKVDALALKISGPYRDAAAQLLAKAADAADLRAAADCSKVEKDIKAKVPNLASMATDSGDCCLETLSKKHGIVDLCCCREIARVFCEITRQNHR